MTNIDKKVYVGRCRYGNNIDIPCNWVNSEGRCGADTFSCQISVIGSRIVKIQEEE